MILLINILILLREIFSKISYNLYGEIQKRFSGDFKEIGKREIRYEA